MFRLIQTLNRVVVTISATLLTVAAVGCACLDPVPVAPWIEHGPTPVSPERRSLYYSPSTTPAPGPAKTPEVPPETDHATPELLPEPLDLPLTPVPPAERVPPDRAPADEKPLVGPRIIPQDVTVPARLELSVTAPREADVGSRVTFYLTIQNVGDEPAEEVVVESEFDEALVFPGRDEKRVRRTVGRLEPQETRELPLTLLGEQAGEHCARFTVTSQGVEAVWKSVCVEFIKPS